MADTKIVVNCSTGEVTELELTAEETAQRAKDAADYAKAKADEDAAATDRATAKTALLAKLGISADEAALLLG
jgi:hypothetical protein